MRVTTEGYASVVRQLVDAATNGSIAFVTEGGYDLGALSDCLDAAIAEASGTASRLGASASAGDEPSSTARAARALDTVRAAQKGFWHNL
jgi:acetoin utilization deacetylase AcuC-like enzyme